MERTIKVGAMAVLFATLSVGSAVAEDAVTEAPTEAAVPSDVSYVPSNVNELLAPGSRRYMPGVRMGTFVAIPIADASVTYDDNVFSKSDKTGDFITNVNAGAGLMSNWSRHALEVYAGGGGSFYSEYDTENQVHGTVGIAGLIDIQRGLWVKASTRYSLAYEPRGYGESTLNFDEPIQTQTAEGNLLIHKEFNRLWFETAGSARRSEYGDGSIDGVEVDQSFRNGTIYDAVGRTGYEFSPKMSLFVEGNVNTRDFTDRSFEGDGYKALVGFRREITRILYGEVAAGNMHFHSATNLRDVDTWTYRGQLRWDATPLIMLSLIGSRDLGTPTDVAGDSNVIETDFGARADYAFRRDITLMAGSGYGWSDYVDIGRLDNHLKMMTGAEYQFRPRLSLWGNYTFTRFETDASNEDYNKNVMMLGLRARY
jgi:hypothetical protein